MYMPLNYDRINIAAGTTSPASVKSYDNRTFAYWQRSLCQRAMSDFIFTLPDNWQGSVRDFLQFCLIKWGYVAVFDSEKFGFTFQPCTLYGINWYYQPVSVLIVNPALEDNLKLDVGTDCELMKLTPDYMGLWDIIEYYAEKLSTLDAAINTSIVNSKLAWILGAKNKSSAAAIKSALDKINEGEPAVVLDSKLVSTSKKPSDNDDPWKLIDLEIKKNYILTDLLLDFQTILNNFDSEIGIPTIPYQKRERMVTSEAESRIFDSQSRAIVWFETLKSSIDIINQHFGKSINVEMRYPTEGGSADGAREVNTDRPL